MDYFEHPIVGDVFYGKHKAEASRLFLHAQSLSFLLPGGTKKTISIDPDWDLSAVTGKSE